MALADNGAVGRKGALPWCPKLDTPSDMAHFRHVTLGGAIIMGTGTFESLNEKPLPERLNIVLSTRRSAGYHGTDTIFCRSAEDAISLCVAANIPPFFIGGAGLYDYVTAHQLIDSAYITRIQSEPDNCDTFIDLNKLDFLPHQYPWYSSHDGDRIPNSVTVYKQNPPTPSAKSNLWI